MSLLTGTKLIGKRLRPTDYRQYIAELFLIGLLGSVYLGIDGLRDIHTHAPIAAIPRDSIALIGAIGLYAIRLSSFVAMARDYRMPQTLEWWIFLIPTAAMAVCFLLSGTLVKTYASAHHYRLCYRETDRAPNYVFAAPSVACPPLPPDAVPD